MSAATEARVFDMDLALERAGGSAELADELFQMLLMELPRFLDGIRSAHKSGDLATLTFHIHKLNGASTYCGVPELKATADDLETRIKRGETGDLDARIAQLVKAIDRVQSLPPPRFA